MAYINLYKKGENKPRNTGIKNSDVTESLLDILILSNGFAFDNVQAFENKQQWKDAIKAKKIVPLYDVYELADASTEDTKFESGNFSKITEKGVEKITFECFLNHYAYQALKSYEESSYKEVFEFNKDADYSGIKDADDVRVRGRKVKSISFTRKRATKDKPAHITGEIVYEDKDDTLINDVVITRSDLIKDDLDGIYDINLIQSSATSTVIKVKATSGCCGDTYVDALGANDFIIKDASGSVQSVTFEEANFDNEYTFIGSGFTSGFTVEINGVVVQPDVFYEGVQPLTITV